MFDNFFWSTSVNFKAERSWMLRLLCAGLNSDDDAMIYIRNSILETLMSFYVSPLSDFESKNLIFEVNIFLKFVFFFSYLSIVVLQVVVSVCLHLFLWYALLKITQSCVSTQLGCYIVNRITN